MAKWLPLYMSFLCWCLASPATCSQNVTDQLALLSFKQAIEQDPYQILSFWNESEHYCLWPGISCSSRYPGRVSALRLSSQGLVGTLSPHIGNLSFLRVIDLQDNSFYGQIPPEIGRLQHLAVLALTTNFFVGDIPTNLSNCSKLELLYLPNNKLTGKIPAEFGSLSKLLVLSLEANKLSGTIPPSVGNISSLEELFLLANHLQGQLPDELSRLHKLFKFQISDNNLTGEIPRHLYNISSMETFEIYSNQFRGTIPSDIGLTLPRLSNFAVAFNRFTGSIPVTLTNASVLRNFAFNSNQFTGSIPKDFGKMPLLRYVIFSHNLLQGDISFIDSLTNCSSLEQISIAGNFLNGPIPKSIGNLSTRMIYLALEENNLQNSIPLGLGNLVNLRFLYLSSNFLSGSIPISFGNFQKLQLLNLHNNNLTGIIPSTLGNLHLLTYLNLSSNNLHGIIPSSLGKCSSLIELDLSNNNLNGSIPPQVLSLPSLSIALRLSGNKFVGSIPSEVGLLQGLSQLDLSDNRLSGKIPSSIGKCLKIELLYLKGNSFDGDIPQALTALRGLRELDISRNNFSGKIPDSLVTQLNGLYLLNLSYNTLEGEVPKHGIFLNASAVSLSGNSHLCGGTAELKLPSCVFPKSKKNKLSSALKVSISVVSAAVCLVLLVGFVIFQYRRRMSRRKDATVPSIKHQFMRLSYAELAKATDGFSPLNVIGSGHYSSVYKGILDQTGVEIAVKVVNLQQRGASSSFMSECKALRTVRHRNLMKLLSACSSIDFQGNDFKALVYEFMPNGSLEKWLHIENAWEDEQQIKESRNLKLIQRLNIAIDIASAIEYLHSGCPSTIIHGDLKPSNVLLDDEMTAHVGDFGLAKIISTMSGGAQLHQSGSAAIKGTIGYVAPGTI